MSNKYDIHVATEAGGDSKELRQALAKLGFFDDALVRRGLVFGPQTGRYYSSCMAIDVHVSKKVDNLNELKLLQKNVDKLLKKSRCSGYWHSEWTEFDVSVKSDKPFALTPPSFEPLDVRPRKEHKTWDLHVAMRTDHVPEELASMLLEHGLYSIERTKLTGNFTIWTLQGVNGVREGRQFACALLWWLGRIGAPDFDFKFEITIGMARSGDPLLVPPTVTEIPWK